MHCHLDLYPDPFAVADKCIQEKVYVLSVTTTPKSWAGTSKLEKSEGKIRTALGLHPQLAHLRSHELDLFDSLLPSASYIGEIGLDGSKEYKMHLEIQLKVFRHILNSSQKDGGRIMSIHSRASATLIMDELDKYPNSGTPIFHWFSGSENELKRAIEMGSWFSLGPSMMSSKKGFAIASKIPRNRVLSETDGPFGTFKGQKLMPWDSVKVYPLLASVWNVDNQEADSIILNNFKSLMLANKVH